VATAAYAAAGQLDPTFNATGKVLLPSGGTDNARDVVIQPDGKVVVVGAAPGANDAIVWRYNSDGTPDTTFNAGGTPGSLSLGLAGGSAQAVAVGPDNKVVMVGQVAGGSGFVARLNTNGTLDTAGFGAPNGYVLLNAAGGTEGEFGVAVQSDGKVVSAGTSNGGATIYRRDAAGAPDPSCGGVPAGVKTLGSATTDADAVQLQANGDILVAGDAPLGDGFVARLLGSDCSLDTGGYSAPDGIATLDSGGNEHVLGLALQPDNKAVAAGTTQVSPTNTDGVVYRLNANGALDTSFDTDGGAGIDSGGGESLADVAVQPDGKLVAVGETTVSSGDAAVYRLLANGGPGVLNGALDPSFDSDGAIGIDISGLDFATGVALQPDGKAVVAGEATGPPQTGFLFRLQGDTAAATPGTTPTTPTTPQKRCRKGKKLKKVKGKRKCVKKKHKHK
jgi:uncharacterized delta-60 repeat protein